MNNRVQEIAGYGDMEEDVVWYALNSQGYAEGPFTLQGAKRFADRRVTEDGNEMRIMRSHYIVSKRG